MVFRTQIQAVNSVSSAILLWCYNFGLTLRSFSKLSPPLLGDWGCSHDVHIFGVITILNQRTVFFFAVGAGFLMETLIGVFILVILYEFKILQGLSGSMHQACFISGCIIINISCIFSTIYREALLGVVWIVGFSPHSLPSLIIMVGIFLFGCFIRCFYLMKFL